jgi:NAD(P)-dependent dehydrogenase (short-subunit alcohol dehydrogenase family)
MSLDGKVVFITGGARGIGAAVGAEAAKRGAKISLAGLEPDALSATADRIGDGTPHFDCDVTDFDSVRAAVDGTVSALGGIDIVLANAGIGTYGTVEKGDPDAFLRTIDINLNGVYRTVHATLPHVLERRGYIGVVASIASFAPLAGMSSYNASKAGIEAFVRALRQEVGFRGVDAGSIHPSWIDTDMVRDAERDLASFREARSKLPWPLKSTTSVEKCAQAIVDGFEKRSARVFVPKAASMAYWLRSLITSGVAERATSGEAAELVPRMEAEIKELGRSGSMRYIPSHDPADDEGAPAEDATKVADNG